MSNGKIKKVTVFIDTADNFTVEVKLSKVGCDYIILDSDEWMELQAKKPDTDACFGHPERIASKIDVTKTPKYSIIMKILHGQKCVFLKRHIA